MKISNETKIGALTIVAIVFLFLGFNFLKGKSLFKSGFYLYAKFPQAAGLVPSNAVFVNGFQVGNVSAISATNDVREILVEIKLNKDYQIPKGSTANIATSLTGSPSVNITLNDSSRAFLQSKDTLITTITPGLFSQVKPMTDQATLLMKHLDSVMQSVNNVLDSSSQRNLRQLTANLAALTNGMVQTAQAINTALDLNDGPLSASVKHFNTITGTLAGNSKNIDSIMYNLQVATKGFSQLDLSGTLSRLQSATDSLSALLVQVKSPNSSVGAIINNKDFYNNINTTVNSLHILLDDLRAHPKRYINISVFGKKDKGNYLTQPLPTDSLPPSITK